MPNAYSGRVRAAVSPFVREQFPSFYREEGPRFIEFLTEYYRWKETEGPLAKSRRMLDYVDVDATEEEYLRSFAAKYLVGVDGGDSSRVRFLVKHVVDVYRSKGSLDGLKLLFRLLYSTEADVYVPSVDMLAPSGATWKRPQYVEVSESPLNESFRQKRIRGYNSGATAIAEDYVEFHARGRPARVLYLSGIRGSFQVGEKVYSAASDLKDAPFITGSAGTLTLSSGPANSAVGDEYAHLPGEMVVRVSSVDSDGTGSLEFTLLDGGFGYTLDAAVTVVAGEIATEDSLPVVCEDGSYLDAAESGSAASLYVSALTDTETVQVPTTLLLPHVDDLLSGNAVSTYLPVITENLRSVVTESDEVLLAETSGSTAFTSLALSDWVDYRDVTVGTVSAVVTTSPGSGYASDATVHVWDELIGPEGLSDGAGGVMGDDASVYAEASSGDDTASTVKVYSSGFSYFEGERVTAEFISEENVTAEDGSTLVTESGDRVAWGRSSELSVTGTVTLAAVGVGEGRWVDEAGMLNSSKRVQDSYYYQEYSYDVRSRLSLDRYESTLKMMYHPAGVELFGTTVVDSDSSDGVTGSTEVTQSDYDYTVLDLIESRLDGAAFRFIDERVVVKSSSNTHNDYDGSVGGRVACSRASQKMVWRSGVLTAVAADALPYDEHPLTGESLGLLIEGSATNALTNTSTMSDSSWHTARVTVTGGYPAPDGTNTAFAVTESVVSGRKAVGKQDFTVTANSTYAFSAYVKLKPDGNVVYPMLLVSNGNNASSVRAAVVFDVVSGTHQAGATSNSGAYSPAVLAAGMEECPDGWWRVWAAAQIGGSDSTLGFYLTWETSYVNSNIGPSYTGDGVTGIYAWCPMVEVGKLRPSSPVQSGSSPGTRAADAITASASTYFPFGSQYTAAASYTLPYAAGVDERVAAAADSGTDAEEVAILASSALGTGVRGRSSSAAQFDLFDVPDCGAAATPYRVVASVATGSAVAAADGTLGSEDATVSVPAVSVVRFGHDSDGNFLDGHLRSFLVLCGVAESDSWVQEVSVLNE